MAAGGGSDGILDARIVILLRYADAVDVQSNKDDDPGQCWVGGEAHEHQARALTVGWVGGKKGGRVGVLHGKGTWRGRE